MLSDLHEKAKIIPSTTASSWQRKQAHFDYFAILNHFRYSIFAYQGKRSAQAQHWIDFIKKREWVLLILDEVQTVPADSVCRMMIDMLDLLIRVVQESTCESAGKVHSWADSHACARRQVDKRENMDGLF